MGRVLTALARAGGVVFSRPRRFITNPILEEYRQCFTGWVVPF